MAHRRTWPLIVLACGLALAVAIAWFLQPQRAQLDGSAGGTRLTDPASSSDVPAISPSPTTAHPLPLLDATAGAPPEALAQSAPASLRVRVRWGSDGTPAAGIGLTVKVSEPERDRYVRHVLTDERGEWIAASLPSGSAWVRTDRDAERQVSLPPGRETVLEFSVRPGVHLRGLVTDPQGAPVPGAAIWLSSKIEADEGQAVAQADAAGRFELRDVQDGWRVGARSARHAPSGLERVWAKVGSEADVVLVVGGACGALQCVVVGHDDRPVPGATVRVGPPDGWPDVSRKGRRLDGPASFVTVTDAAGALTLEGLPVGVHPITVVCQGYSPYVASVEIRDGEVTHETLRLPDAAQITGVVRNEQGQPVAGAFVGIGQEEDASSSGAVTGPDGRYVLQDAPLGSREVYSGDNVQGWDVRRLIVVPGASLVCDFTLSLGPTIEGVLLDDHGVPAANWRMLAGPQPGEQHPGQSATTDETGRFALHGLDEAAYRLSATGTEDGAELLLASDVRPGVRDLELRLPASWRDRSGVAGRLVDADGAPIVSAYLSLVDATFGRERRGVPTDTSGRFELKGLAPDTYTLRVATWRQHRTVLGSWLLAPGSCLQVGDLVLADGGTFVVRLQPDPPPGATGVHVTLRAPGWIGEVSLARDGGVFRSPALAAGTYELFVAVDGFAIVRQPVSIEDGRERSADVTLSAAVQQTLRVRVPASVWESVRGTALHLLVRDGSAATVYELDTGLAATDGEVRDPEAPASEFVLPLIPGAYVVEASLGNAPTRRLPFATSAVAWEVDLR